MDGSGVLDDSGHNDRERLIEHLIQGTSLPLAKAGITPAPRGVVVAVAVVRGICDVSRCGSTGPNRQSLRR